MEYRILGRSGIRVSKAALGTMTFGSGGDPARNEQAARQIFDMFAEAGGNLIDTANSYGDGASESILGNILAGRRDRFVLSTKYTIQTDPTDPNSAGSSRKSLISSLEASLRRLRTDRIDLYWVHLRDQLTPVEEIMRALDDQIRAGKILAIGVSDWTAWEAAEASTYARMAELAPISAVQIRYSLLDRTAEPDILPMARHFGITPIGWGPLSDGRLTGKYLGDPEGGGRGRLSGNGWFQFSREGSDHIVREVVDIAASKECSPAQVAISWILGHRAGVIPLLAGRTPEQFQDNMRALDVELTESQRARLDELSAPDLFFPHNVTREHSISLAGHGHQLPLIDDDRAREVLSLTTYRHAPDGYRN